MRGISDERGLSFLPQLGSIQILLGIVGTWYRRSPDKAESWKAGPASIVRCCRVLVKSITGSDALGAEGWENTVAFRFRIRTRMSEVNPKEALGRVESAGTLKDPVALTGPWVQ